MKNAALYVRTANAPAGEIIKQTDFLMDFVKNMGDTEVGKLYIDHNHSGADFKRTGLNDLLSDALNKKMDCIVIRDFSRLGRDYVKVLALMKLLRHLNIRLISIGEKYDSFSERKCVLWQESQE